MSGLPDEFGRGGVVKMESHEYKLLQERLEKKIQNNPYSRTSNFKSEKGYEEGILAAKSILHSYYKQNSERKEREYDRE